MEGQGGGSPLGSGAGCSPRRQHAPHLALGVTQVRAFGQAASWMSQRFSPHFCESLFYTPAPIAMMVGRGNPCLCALDKQEQVKHPCEGGLCPCRYSCIQELCPQRALDLLPACAGGGCSPLGFPSGTGLPTQLLCPAGHGAAGGVHWAGSCCQSSTGVCMWQWGGLDSGPAAPAQRSPRLPPSLLPPRPLDVPGGAGPEAAPPNPDTSQGAQLGEARSRDPGDGGASRGVLGAEPGPAAASTQRDGGVLAAQPSPVPVSRFGRARGREWGTAGLAGHRQAVCGWQEPENVLPLSWLHLSEAGLPSGWVLGALHPPPAPRRQRRLTRAPTALKVGAGSVFPAPRPHSLQPEAGVCLTVPARGRSVPAQPAGGLSPSQAAARGSAALPVLPRQAVGCILLLGALPLVRFHHRGPGR